MLPRQYDRDQYFLYSTRRSYRIIDYQRAVNPGFRLMGRSTRTVTEASADS